jgi:hypothetical protein
MRVDRYLCSLAVSLGKTPTDPLWPSFKLLGELGEQVKLLTLWPVCALV